MPLSTAVTGLKHEPKERNMGHQGSAQGRQIQKRLLHQGKAQV